MATKKERERRAISYLKAAYRHGTGFPDGRAILEDLRLIGGSLAGCTLAQSSDYDRKARYELYREGFFVEQPTAITSQRRVPNATVGDRKVSQRARLRELITRLDHQLLAAIAAAASPDSTANEAVVVRELELALSLVTTAVDRISA